MPQSFAVTIAYDGTRYSGWQRQGSGKECRQPTIQGELEQALKQITQQAVSVVGSGRTDAGVHARSQVAHFSCSTRLTVPQLRQALNALLPVDIRVQRLRPVAPGFHARYSCLSKTYRYVIYNHAVAPVFDRWFVWHIAAPLRVDLMAQAAAVLIGTHDFSSFQARDKVARSAVRTVRRLVVRSSGRYIFIDIEADGFVYTMVRSIVGALAKIGRGTLPVEAMKRILNARDRAASCPTAPANGLTLYQVRY